MTGLAETWLGKTGVLAFLHLAGLAQTSVAPLEEEEEKQRLVPKLGVKWLRQEVGACWWCVLVVLLVRAGGCRTTATGPRMTDGEEENGEARGGGG